MGHKHSILANLIQSFALVLPQSESQMVTRHIRLVDKLAHVKLSILEK